jgi:lipopolysaccharide-induced tumor necrosis factor-alpha factor
MEKAGAPGSGDGAYPRLPEDLPPPYYPETGSSHQQPQGMPQPDVGFKAPAPQQPNPQVVQLVQIMNLGPRSTRMLCPHCGADVETRIKYNPGRMTHLVALILCLVCWPCVCVPYCIDDCMDAEHDCPNCDRHIGTYKR